MCVGRRLSSIMKELQCRVLRILSFSSIPLLVGVLLTGCIESGPRLERLFSLQVRTADLPSGWFVDGVGIGNKDSENEEILSRWIQFRGVPEAVFPAVQVIHELTDYPDLDQATIAYAEIVEEQFPVDEWVWPGKVQSENHADEYHLACLDVQAAYADVDEQYFGMYHCTAVGRYGTTVSVINANVFQDKWLTFEDLQHLLEAADARLANGTNQP